MRQKVHERTQFKNAKGEWEWQEFEYEIDLPTEEETAQQEKAEQAKRDEKAALRAKVSALAKEPPKPQDLAQALSDLAKAVEALI